jgi:hypothetical protein
MNVASPGVVTQAFPEFENKGFVCCSYSWNTRQDLHPAVIVVKDSSYPGLLQHHLRDPDTVSQIVSTPGKIPLMLFKPSK